MSEHEHEEVKKGKKSIDVILKEIQKKFSKTNPDIVFDPQKQYEALSSGNLIFDLVTGIGGFPRGRITEVIGMESSCKSSLIYSTLGVAQKKGLKVALLDAEQCYSRSYAESCYDLKLDQKTFFLFQPVCIEEADTILDMLMDSSDKFDIIAIDSIACLTPRAVQEGSLEEAQGIGIHARKVSQFMHKLKKYCYLDNFAAICTNQLKYQIQRDQYTPGIGIATGYKFKDQYITPGGMTPRFLASIRMLLEISGKAEDTNVKDPLTGETSDEKTIKLIKIINIKNKCATPGVKNVTRFCMATSTRKGGWNAGMDLLELLRRMGRVTQSGATFKYQGLSQEWTFRGKANGENAFINTPEILQDAFALYEKLRQENVETDKLVDKAILGEDFTEGDQKERSSEIEIPSLETQPLDISSSGNVSL